MSRSTIARCFTLVAIALLLATPGAQADVRINSVNIISKVSIAKNVFEYVAQAKVQNTGPTVAELRATATSRDAATVLLDAAVLANKVPSGNSSTADTIRFRGGNSAPNKLQWRVLTRTDLSLDGIARTGTPAFAGAAVEATVSRDLSGTAAADWGRPNVETFAGGATDVNGRFSVPVVILAPTDFVTIRVTGANGAVLGAIVGHASDLIAANGGRANTTTYAQTSRLVISPFSTSAWALGQQALIDGLQTAGTRIVSEAQWRSLLRISDSWAILTRAAYIKAIIENPALPKPAGYTDTFALATKDSAADAFRKLLQVADPNVFFAGLWDLVATLSVPYTAATVPATLFSYVGDPRNGLPNLSPERYSLLPDGTGTRQTAKKTIPLTWSLDTAGRIALTLNDTATEAIIVPGPDYPCTIDPSGQVRVRYYDESTVLARMHDAGSTALIARADGSLRTEYPDCPQYGPFHDQFKPTQQSLSLGVTALSNQGFPFAIGGQSFALFFPLTGFADYCGAVGLGDCSYDLGGDILEFASDGTGHLQRTGMAFTWQLTATQELSIQFSNGDTLLLRHLATTGGIHSVWLAGTVSGLARIGASALIPLDGSQITIGANGITLRNGIGEEQSFFTTEPASSSQIDYSSQQNGTGCRRFVYDDGHVLINPYLWYLRDGRFDFTWSSGRNARFYQPIRYVPARSLNDMSTGGWITLETLQIQTPIDPTTSPGRFNFLRNLGPAVPCSN